MEDRNETQTSESPEERGQRLHRCQSMEKLIPSLSCDPVEPVKFDSDVKTEERFSNPSSLTSSQQCFRSRSFPAQLDYLENTFIGNITEPQVVFFWATFKMYHSCKKVSSVDKDK